MIAPRAVNGRHGDSRSITTLPAGNEANVAGHGTSRMPKAVEESKLLMPSKPISKVIRNASQLHQRAVYV
jgi:hypothetical protein